MTYEGKPVSLYPLKFKDAVKELLKVMPEPWPPRDVYRLRRYDPHLPELRPNAIPTN